MPNDKLPEEPSITNAEPSESHTFNRVPSPPLAAPEETPKASSTMNVMEPVSELPQTDISNTSIQDAPRADSFQKVYQTALETLLPSILNSEQARSVPIVRKPSGSANNYRGQS